MAGGYSPEGGSSTASTRVDGDDAVRPRRRGGEPVRAQNNTAHGLVTYADGCRPRSWYGRPDLSGFYCGRWSTSRSNAYRFTPAIEGDFWYGHHYEMFRMADTFRRMIQTRKEPVPHREILEVTAIIHAGAKSAEGKKPAGAAGRS